MHQPKTAILVFAQSAQKEAQDKGFFKSAELFEQLNAHTLQVVEGSGLPYFHISEKQQKGNSFGERYVNAIQTVFDSGFENIITIGNDTPHLQTRHITEAAEKLTETSLVLGPSFDGGYYLMGLQKAHFHPASFLKLPWQTARLSSKLIDLFTQKDIQVHKLETLTDIDALQDAKKIRNAFRSIRNNLQKVLEELFSVANYIVTRAISFTSYLLTNTLYNKGSPQLM
ncbi:TIGR04282 family arsenosugar biosynthesis glycosyltransferase [Luteirhabdus pelagi]|uniref:TIGR04282 family arsenosugar biosynthesis glycosyltransferase n=1 Tax=Luteirhabdus pelagi TaxID=2792783 RepID=UPI00193A67EE|nr:DUF2064 domain-containing protein [Luteirhabdus pelagi]